MNDKKWNAGGFAEMARFLGWNPPIDERGIWMHEEAGNYHDSIMGLAVLTYANRVKWMKANDNVEFNIRQMRQRLLEIEDLYNQTVDKCQDEQDEFTMEALQKAGYYVQEALKVIGALRFENV